MYIDLKTLNSSQGFKIVGANAGDNAGFSVSNAGDVNADGIADFAIGAWHASPLGCNQAGETYVIYGKKSGYPSVDLGNFNGTVGFKILGATSGGCSGYAVVGAVDINNDRIDDIIIGAPNAGVREVYVIYGKKGGYNAGIDLSWLDNAYGFKIIGDPLSSTGNTVNSAGDINNDTIKDIIIGAYSEGAGYVIYGRKCGYTDIDLGSTFSKLQGFRVSGSSTNRDYGDNLGRGVSGGFDINYDGITDIIITAPQGSPLGMDEAGLSYVIYGKSEYFDNIDFRQPFNITQGFKILGASAGDKSGTSASGVSDVNGDGIDDIIVGAAEASPLGRTQAGMSYVIYGKRGGYEHDIDLNFFDNIYGFKILGANNGDYAGGRVSNAGDVNGDGIADIIIGAPLASNSAGVSYIIFGRKGGYNSIDLSQLDDTQGFKILGEGSGDQSGYAASYAGDINFDGIDDVIIGAYTASPLGRSNAGVSYVIYGKNFTTKISDLDGDHSSYNDNIHDFL